MRIKKQEEVENLSAQMGYMGVLCKCLQCGKEWRARTYHKPHYCPNLADRKCPRPWFWDLPPEQCPPPRKFKRRKRKRSE